MKFACSSRSFAPAFAEGRLAHLEWLDVCANELEVDGVVLAAGDLPRTDDQYLAQVKKTAVDLGLTIAAVEMAEVWEDPALAFALAAAVGAPLIATRATAQATEPGAAGAFVVAARRAARAAKAANVTLALRPAPGTLCATGVELKGLLKDVDGAWLRPAFDTATDPTGTPLERAVIAYHELGSGDAAGIASLARFRGFIVLEAAVDREPRGYHAALTEFRAARERSLAIV